MAVFQEIKERIAAGDAAGALAAAKATVRNAPSDPSARTALFGLFAINGEWARAAEQLETARTLGCDPSLAVYEIILKSISEREKVISGETDPHFPAGDPPVWFASWKGALSSLRSGDDSFLAAAVEERLASLDAINGFNAEFEFEGFRNCDSRLSGVFEGIFEGRYSWIPFEDVLRIAVPERPELLQDFVWLPVMIHLKKGGALKGYLSATYPGTGESGEGSEKLARSTGWDDRFEETDIGRGLQLFALGSEVVPVFSLGQCSLNTPATVPLPSDTP